MDSQIRKNMAVTTSDSKRMHATIAIPSVCDFYFTPHRFSALGPHVLSKILASCDIDNEIINFPLRYKSSQNIDLPNDIRYLNPFLFPNETGKTSYFTKFQRFGKDSLSCAKEIVSLRPQLCFISCFAFSYAKEALDLATDIKRLNGSILTIIGGAGVSCNPLYFVENEGVDFVIDGEAEIVVPAFIDALKNNLPMNTIPGLAYKDSVKNQSFVKAAHTQSNEIIPAISKVLETKKTTIHSVSISRGCNRNCSFCSNDLTHGKGLRLASIERVSVMVKSVSIDQNKRNLINFEDDNLLFDIEYFLKVIRIFKNQIPDVSFLAENGLDYMLLSKENADALIDLGFKSFNFTIGSIDETVLEKQNRKGHLFHFESLVRHIASKNIPVLSYFICGLNGDSLESVTDILAYLFKLPTQIGISMFYAIPGIADFKDLNLFNSKQSCTCNGSSAFPWYGSLSTKELITAFRLSRLANLMKLSAKSDIEIELVDKTVKDKRLYSFFKTKNKIHIEEVPNVSIEMVEMFLEKIA